MKRKLRPRNAASLYGLRAVRLDVHVDGAEDEEVVAGKASYFGSVLVRERVFRRQFMEAEALLEQILEQVAGRIFDVDPEPRVAVALPALDQRRISLSECVAVEDRHADSGHFFNAITAMAPRSAASSASSSGESAGMAFAATTANCAEPTLLAGVASVVALEAVAVFV